MYEIQSLTFIWLYSTQENTEFHTIMKDIPTSLISQKQAVHK